jgi:hypothetical protein
VLALSGLTRETNLLALPAIFDPGKRSRRDLGRLAFLAGLAVAPLAAWLVYIKFHVPHPVDLTGLRNFALPLSGYLNKWREMLLLFFAGHYHIWRTMMLPIIAITTQALFFCCTPGRWRNPWWRLGAAFTGLMMMLGDAVWEGNPGAAPRVLLPMTLAFNLLVPRGRRRLGFLLLLGNAWLLWPFFSF